MRPWSLLTAKPRQVFGKPLLERLAYLRLSKAILWYHSQAGQLHGVDELRMSFSLIDIQAIAKALSRGLQYFRLWSVSTIGMEAMGQLAEFMSDDWSNDIGQIVTQAGQRMMHFIRARVGSDADAEDILQDVCSKAS